MNRPTVAALILLAAACGKQKDMMPERHLAFGDPENLHHPERRSNFDVKHYSIEVVPDLDDRRVHGTVEITFVPTDDQLPAIHLDAAQMTIHASWVDGVRAQTEHVGRVLTVIAPNLLRKGRTYVCGLRYTAIPTTGLFFILPDRYYPDKPRQVWTQGETEYNHHWFPCFDYPNDRATAELWITTPADMVAISNGDLKDRIAVKVTEAEALALQNGQARSWRPHVPAVPRRAGDYWLWHWVMPEEFVSYLVSVAIGEFDMFEQIARVEGREIPVRYNVPRGRIPQERVEAMFGKTPDMIAFYSSLFGVPYPYAKYDQTLAMDFTWGGMENITATTLNGDLIIAAGRPGATYEPESLIAHELVHQWFGDLVTCRTWEHIWLNETFATFFASWWFRQTKGQAEFEHQIWEDMQQTLGQDAGTERAIVNDDYTDPDDMFDTRTYGGGSVMMNQLRNVIGDDAFFSGVHTYLARHRYKSVTTAALKSAMEHGAGRPLDVFFDQWLHGTLYPEFAVSWKHEGGKVALSVEQTHEVTERRRLFKIPVDIGITGPDGKTAIHCVEIDEKSETFTFEAAERPVFVDFDAGSWILKKLVFEKPTAELAYQLEKDVDVGGRLWALGQLAARPDGRAAIEKAALGDPFTGVRTAALAALSDAASVGVLKKARADKDHRIRAAALRSMSRHPGCAADVLDSARTDAAFGVAGAAAGSLRDFDALTALLKERGDIPDVTVGVIRGLTALGDVRGYDIVEKLTAYGTYGWVRDNAVDALASWASSEGPARDRARAKLVELLDDPEFRVRRSALESLGSAGPDAIPVLQVRAASESDARLRRAARTSIRRLRTGE